MFKSLPLRKLQLTALLAAAAAAIALTFVIGGGDATSAETADATTVRIAAQRVEDGRTAFALQVRGDDAWGERIKPRANLFPRVDRARVGRWANSSLLELDSGHTVRISARLQDNGQIEFALQEIIDDTPAERILPRLRKFPAKPTIGKWLYSSPIELPARAPEAPMVEEPAVEEPTYVPIVNVSGQAADTVWYEASTWEDEIDSRVANTVSVESAHNGLLGFTVGCWSGSDGSNLYAFIGWFNPSDAEFLDVTLEIDGVALPAESWPVTTSLEEGSDGPVPVASLVEHPDAAELIARLRDASSLSVTIDGSGLPPVAFDLAGMFDTPIQGNIDNCGNYVEGETRELVADYVPWVGAERISATLSYRTWPGSDQYVTSLVEKDVPTAGAVDGRLRLTTGCWDGSQLDIRIAGLPESPADSLMVTISTDDGAEVAERWRAWTSSGRLFVASPDPYALIARLAGASSATFTVEDSDLTPVTFDLTGVYDTPIQANLDNCGRHKPGETRELDLPESPVVRGWVTAPDSESRISWGSTPTGSAVPFTFAQQGLWADGAVAFSLRLSCDFQGPQMTVFGSRFGELIEGDIQVAWSLDGGTEQTETWRAVTFQFVVAHPVSVWAMVDAWRDASTLDLTLHTDTPHTQRFHLAELFSTPIQSQLDQCLSLAPPNLSLPAGVIDDAREGQLRYFSSSGVLGSSVVSSRLFLGIAGDDAPAGLGFSSGVSVACGLGGPGISVYGPGLVEPTFIRGYAAAVLWSVDGGPKNISTWDVWPFFGDGYALSPQDDAAFYAAINGADSLRIEILADPIFTETYDLAGNGFWTTPVQPNLDACVDP